MVRLNENTMGYEARPDSHSKAAGIIVIHEVTGLIDYIKEVTRNLAANGFLGLAVDLYEGKTAKNLEEGTPLQAKVTTDVFKEKIGAALTYLHSQDYCSGQVGVMGFCMGGGFALWAACLFPQQLGACSVFYGMVQDLELLKNLKAPVLGNFGAEDKKITTWAVEQLKPAMATLGKRLDLKVYPGAPHGFHNHTRSERYRSEAAEDAFQRTVAFFSRQFQ
jgi:carboxymethylenebutenolidase